MIFYLISKCAPCVSLVEREIDMTSTEAKYDLWDRSKDLHKVSPSMGKGMADTTGLLGTCIAVRLIKYNVLDNLGGVIGIVVTV